MSQSSRLNAALAGICYPDKPAELLSHFESWFRKADLSSALTTKAKPNKRFLGVLSPHIDFRVSPVSYAHALASLASAPVAETYIILGVGHRAHQEWSCDPRGFTTPLGTVESNREFVQSLIKNVSPQLANDPTAYTKEHSIEFPLICLQAWRKLRGIEAPFNYVPILCGGLAEFVLTQTMPGSDNALYKLAAALKNLVTESKGKTQVIVSIDGCHIGPRFGHEYAVTPAILKDCRQWEDRLWNHVSNADLSNFLSYLMEDGNQRYFDGVGALGLILAAFSNDLKPLKRTHYEQWFEARDASAVTFSSGLLETN